MGEAIYYDARGQQQKAMDFFHITEKSPQRGGIKEVIALNGLGYPIRTTALFSDGDFYRYGSLITSVVWWKEITRKRGKNKRGNNGASL